MSQQSGSPSRIEVPAEQVVVFDTTLRDGEQSAGVCFSADDKVEVAAALASMGVDVVEAGFPVSSAAECEAVRRVAQEVRDTRVCALARAVPKDVEVAGDALRDAAAGRIHVFVNSSDMQLESQLNKTRSQVVGMAGAMVALARQYTDDVEFSPMDATRADPEFLVEVLTAAVQAGAATLNIPDTVGCARPDQVAALITRLRERVPGADGVVFSFHGQDDLGMATANTLAAVGAGARQVELAVNGIGERAGNTALEEVVVALAVHGAAWGVRTGVDATGLYGVSRLVEEKSGMPVAPNKALVGRNAFCHASGIHQDGVLKEPATYEVIDPARIGRADGSRIVLGKLSGRAGFAARARALGFALPGAELGRAFRRFQEVASRCPEVDDETLGRICGDGAGDGAARRRPGYALDL